MWTIYDPRIVSNFPWHREREWGNRKHTHTHTEREREETGSSLGKPYISVISAHTHTETEREETGSSLGKPLLV